MASRAKIVTPAAKLQEANERVSRSNVTVASPTQRVAPAYSKTTTTVMNHYATRIREESLLLFFHEIHNSVRAQNCTLINGGWRAHFSLLRHQQKIHSASTLLS